MDEVLLIDKPQGWTSFDVVAKVRSSLRREQMAANGDPKKRSTVIGQRGTLGPKVRVGHAGTLDPLATGLLIVLIGKATKRQTAFMKLDKVYEVEMKLGETSTTADAEGEKKAVSNTTPTEKAVLVALQSFTGPISQLPPAFSAIKVNGQRAYKLARAGKEVALEPRQVTIYGITEVEYKYPLVKFTAKVSSGTYIRSLVVDIGEKLGTGAYMTNLRRTQIGPYKVTDSQNLNDLQWSKP
jgi:tRNA pseudouridine55 synthase